MNHPYLFQVNPPFYPSALLLCCDDIKYWSTYVYTHIPPIVYLASAEGVKNTITIDNGQDTLKCFETRRENLETRSGAECLKLNRLRRSLSIVFRTWFAITILTEIQTTATDQSDCWISVNHVLKFNGLSVQGSAF